MLQTQCYNRVTVQVKSFMWAWSTQTNDEGGVGKELTLMQKKKKELKNVVLCVALRYPSLVCKHANT